VLKVNPSWICCKTDDMDEKPPALTEKDAPVFETGNTGGKQEDRT